MLKRPFPIPRAAMGALLAVGALAGPAPAEITPSQLWEQWQAQAEAHGITLEAEVKRAGDGLRLQPLAWRLAAPDDSAVLRLRLDSVSLNARDGGVDVALAPAGTLGITLVEEGSTTDIGVILRQEGFAMRVEGSPQDQRLRWQLDRMTADLDSLASDGEEIDARMQLVIEGDEGTSHLLESASGLVPVASEERIRRITLELAAVAPPSEPEGGRIDARGEWHDFRVGMTANATTFAAMGPGTLLAPDAEYTLRIEHAGSEFRIAGEGADGPFTLGAEDGGMSIGLDRRGDFLSAETELRSAAWSATGRDIPVPKAEVALDRLAFALSVPVVPTEEPRPLTLSLAMQGLAPGMGLWQLLDPSGVLPREPFDLLLDLSGSARVTEDLREASAEASPPFEISSLVLNRLALSALGARAEAAGRAAIEMAPGGEPVAEGSLDIRLEGVGTLTDRLLEAGLVPEEQILGLRAMLGALARPAPEGGDVWISHITVTRDGSVTANGVPLQ